MKGINFGHFLPSPKQTNLLAVSWHFWFKIIIPDKPLSQFERSHERNYCCYLEFQEGKKCRHRLVWAESNRQKPLIQPPVQGWVTFSESSGWSRRYSAQFWKLPRREIALPLSALCSTASLSPWQIVLPLCLPRTSFTVSFYSCLCCALLKSLAPSSS